MNAKNRASSGRRFGGLLVLTALMASVAGCGDGGVGSTPPPPPPPPPPAPACMTGDASTVRLSYLDLSSDLAQTVGKAADVQPYLAGLPSSCVSKSSFSTGTTPLPPGLAIDSSTGEMSGTPTQEGAFDVTVHLTIAGVSGESDWSYPFRVRDRSAYEVAFAGVPSAHFPMGDANEYQPSQAVFTLHGDLAELRTFGSTVRVSRSSDVGHTWQVDTSAIAPSLQPYRILASSDDASAVVLGYPPQSSSVALDVWRFDGTNWTAMATSALIYGNTGGQALVSVPAGVFMVNAHLPVSGAEAPVDGILRSTDGGATWTALKAPYEATETVVCGFEFKGQVVVATTGTAPRLWSSADGAAWTRHDVAATSPLQVIRAGSFCTGSSEKAMVLSQLDGANPQTMVDIATSTDLTNWHFAARSYTGENGADYLGGFVLGGKLAYVQADRPTLSGWSIGLVVDGN